MTEKKLLQKCNANAVMLQMPPLVDWSYAVIWPISNLKISKMSKNVFLAKSSGSQWVNMKSAFSSEHNMNIMMIRAPIVTFGGLKLIL